MKLWLVEQSSLDSWEDLGQATVVGVFTSPELAQARATKDTEYRYLVTEIEADSEIQVAP